VVFLAMLLTRRIVADDTVVKVIPLQSRAAADLVAVLAPMAGPDGSVTALDTRLVVKATPAALARIEEALRALDTPARSLLITVSMGRSAVASGRGAAVGGQVGGGGTTVTVSPSAQGGGTTVTTRTNRTVVTGAFGSQSASEAGDDTQQIRVLDGYPAFISRGRSVPINTVGVVPTPSGPALASGTTFAESGSGFYVRPRLAGDLVTLELWIENTRGDDRGTVAGSRAQTTVSSRLGDWVEVGEALREAQSRAKALLGGYQADASVESNIRVRVEEVR
jgi:type II secretory pathway component GspD/PulD (secretin)